MVENDVLSSGEPKQNLLKSQRIIAMDLIAHSIFFIHTIYFHTYIQYTSLLLWRGKDPEFNFLFTFHKKQRISFLFQQNIKLLASESSFNPQGGISVFQGPLAPETRQDVIFTQMIFFFAVECFTSHTSTLAGNPWPLAPALALGILLFSHSVLPRYQTSPYQP